MKCHYEVLGVSQEANDDDLKKSYRKLALKWHPDKNPDNLEEAHKQFQVIQAAYDALSDPQERAWYDKHRDQILMGAKESEHQQNAVNIYEYFTSACYSGFGDDNKGFYAVYRELFSNIAEEDLEFATDVDSDFEIPEFGDSKSDYEEVVRPFYAYWQSYCTFRTYSWVDKYTVDMLREVPRRVQRLMERDNKKIRDSARKERNEEIRGLVSFVRKRDPRVKSYIKLLEEKAAQNVLKTKQQQERHREQRAKLLEEAQENRFAQMSELEEQLKLIESQYTASEEDSDSSIEDGEPEEGDAADGEENIETAEHKFEESESESDSESMELYCPACKKAFKTVKARESHDRSKKHKDKVRILRRTLLVEEGVEDGEEGDLEEDAPTDSGKKEKKRGGKIFQENDSDEEEETEDVQSVEADEMEEREDEDDDEEEETISKSRSKKKKSKKVMPSSAAEVEERLASLHQDDEPKVPSEKMTKKKKRQLQKQQQKEQINPAEDARPDKDVRPEKSTVAAQSDKKESALSCAVCSEQFPSKNKLFEHLKTTNHAIFIDKNVSGKEADKSKRKGRKK